MNDQETRISSLVGAVEADPADVELVREVAFNLCEFVNSYDIPRARRGVYLASVRNHMRRLAGRLDATGLSRLAWLHLLEDDPAGARKYAEMGLSKDSANEHCQRIVRRLDESVV